MGLKNRGSFVDTPATDGSSADHSPAEPESGELEQSTAGEVAAAPGSPPREQRHWLDGVTGKGGINSCYNI